MLTVAYIGFGVSVRQYHIPYVENREDICVKYIYRREEDRIGDMEDEKYYPEIIFTSNIADVWNDPEVGLVVICAPDAVHTKYAKEAMEHGKHVLVEKPFAPTAAEAKEVFSLAKEKGLVCMPNQNRRFDADFLAVKDVLKSGKLGRLVRIESHYDYFKPNGWYDHLGTLYNLGVHTLDQIISLFGKPDWEHLDVKSIHHPGVGDDDYDLELHYGDLKAIVSTRMCVLIDHPRFILHGTKGSFVLPPVIHNSGKKKLPGRHIIDRAPAPEERWGTLRYQAEDGTILDEKVAVDCAHYECIYDSLIDAICNGAEKCIRDEEVVEVLRILEAATEVAKGERKP